MKLKKRFNQGAASFYIVAFSTLILVIIATSFAVAIIAEVTRSSNDELSQSAYDAALAGIEDAKLSFMNYQNCINSGITYPDELSHNTEITCQDIVYWMNHPNCDMVGHILGRIKDDKSGEIPVEESTDASESGRNEMNQAYTCVTIKTKLNDYRASLSSMNPYRIIKVDLEKAKAADIKAVRVNWFLNGGTMTLDYSNYISDRIAFQPLSLVNASTPPTLSVEMIQTATNFTFNQLNSQTSGNKTDRATVYMVPTANQSAASRTTNSTYMGAYKDGINQISAVQMAATNDLQKDLPYLVYCPGNNVSDEYVCSATLNLPNPIGGTRSNDTFMFVVSLPYGQPETDFSLEFICKEGANCGLNDINDDSMGSISIASLDSVQVLIDSTGRANDLYRRIEVRLEPADNAFIYPFYAVQVDKALEKDFTVTSEWDFLD